MDVDGFLNELQALPGYRDQIVHVHEVAARAAVYAPDPTELSTAAKQMLAALRIDRLYSHQAEAVAAARAGEDVVIVTGTASGKSLCYLLPILETLAADPDARALLLFPTKALCQDQFTKFRTALDAAGLDETLAGVYDGDTSPALRRRLRDHGAVVFSNPDMIHAALMPRHARWAGFLGGLRYLVLDEVHVYNGIFGSNMANLLRRFERLCGHYGSRGQIIACSATIANPKPLTERLTARPMTLVTRDGSPRGRRVYVFWNPPRVRGTTYRSRRSANVEAHELMAELIRRGYATITFSKAKMTAEMIHRYCEETLRKTAPRMMRRITPYRGGYLPAERREIERRLFAGELLGVSCTRALELGIDVGALEACIVVGYPGTLAGFLQQTGRAGRGDSDALVVLVGVDTAVNQYVMSHPEYLFDRPIETAVIDPQNPFILTGHLRCATHELPVSAAEAATFGPHAPLVLKVLEANEKVTRIKGAWYHAADETPQHEIGLRDTADRNVIIEDVDTGEVLGQVNKFDAPPILHPGAIYIHRGETFRVESLDIEVKFIARVKRVEVDYYTQPHGGTDVHHVDARLREKPFGAGRACWGEVTAYFYTNFYEQVRFYELDGIAEHGVELPIQQLETMAFWLVPPEELMKEVRDAGLDVHAGLRGIGYATRMLLPLFITCDTLSFSHSIGSVNSPWNAIFVYERHPLGLGFTAKAYDLLHEILPAVLEHIRNCPCRAGCPCCVGKPLRQYATWNIERGEASIPSKAAALTILTHFLGDGTNLRNPDVGTLGADDPGETARLEQALRRRLERMREPETFHPIRPQIETKVPDAEKPHTLKIADVSIRRDRRRDFQKDLRRRIAKKLDLGGLEPDAVKPARPPGMGGRANLPPTAFPGKPVEKKEKKPPTAPIQLGDSLAAKARRLKRKRQKDK